MVGTTGFEPATSRTRSVRATRLRHVPTAFRVLISVSLAFEEGQDCEELFVEIEQNFLARLREADRPQRRSGDSFRGNSAIR